MIINDVDKLTDDLSNGLVIDFLDAFKKVANEILLKDDIRLNYAMNVLHNVVTQAGIAFIILQMESLKEAFNKTIPGSGNKLDERIASFKLAMKSGGFIT